jgi:hypothetical protein
MRALVTVSVLLAAACGAPQQSVRSSATPEGGGQQLDNSAIDVAMERVRPLVQSCMQQGRLGQTWTVRLTILGDGRPCEVQAEGEQGDPTIAACLEGAVSSAQFPQFSGPPMTITYPLYVH